MDRTIRVRSLITDRAEAELSALGRRKEEELEEAGIISSPLFHGICIAPSPEEGRLGYFSASSRLIVIDEAVIEECSQETVRNIFLHELAHLHHHDHGPEFHDLLERLCSDNLTRLSSLGDPYVTTLFSSARRSRASRPFSRILSLETKKYRLL